MISAIVWTLYFVEICNGISKFNKDRRVTDWHQTWEKPIWKQKQFLSYQRSAAQDISYSWSRSMWFYIYVIIGTRRVGYLFRNIGSPGETTRAIGLSCFWASRGVQLTPSCLCNFSSTAEDGCRRCLFCVNTQGLTKKALKILMYLLFWLKYNQNARKTGVCQHPYPFNSGGLF